MDHKAKITSFSNDFCQIKLECDQKSMSEPQSMKVRTWSVREFGLSLKMLPSLGRCIHVSLITRRLKLTFLEFPLNQVNRDLL
jgi:hypothetical protein